MSEKTTWTASTSFEGKCNDLIAPVLMRLTSGLPQHELNIIVNEAEECEMALLQEIAVLESAAAGIRSNIDDEMDLESGALDAAGEKSLPNHEDGPAKTSASSSLPSSLPAVSSEDDILHGDFTPAERFYTLSSLLGRLFVDTPPPPLSSIAASRVPRGVIVQHPPNFGATSHLPTSDGNSNIGNEATPSSLSETSEKQRQIIQRQQQLLALEQNPIYNQTHTDNDAAMLLSLWKKISQHRTSVVFRRPVNEKDAPGYTERVNFPMDLSVVRKLITSGQITSYAQLHSVLALISHNCMKFNGRESEYGIVAKDFESFVDDVILAAINVGGAGSGAATASSNTANFLVAPADVVEQSKLTSIPSSERYSD